MKNRDIKKGARLGPFLVVLCAVAFAIITFAIKPATVLAISQAPYNQTPLPYFMNILYQLAENVAFALCFAVIIYGAIARGTRTAWGLFLIYLLATVLRHTADLGITYFTFSFLDATDVFNAAANMAVECVCAILVLIFAVLVGKSYTQRKTEMQKAARITGDPSKVQTLSLSALYSRKNPLQRCALFAGVLLSALKIVMRIRHDLKYTKVYGAPTDAGEIVLMVAYYLSDVLVCIVVYAVCWLIFSRLLKKDAK